MSDEPIRMNVNETLELDYFIEEINENAVTVDDQPNSDSTSLDYIKRKSSVFNPSDAGPYTLKINDQTIDIEVIPDIPDSVVSRTSDDDPFNTSEKYGHVVSVTQDWPSIDAKISSNA